MADQPDPPDKWRVYEGDDTPDPEPQATPPAPPIVPYGNTPQVPYGGSQVYNPVVITRSSGAGPKIVILLVALAVLGGVIAAAVAIFAAVGGGIEGLGGIDSQDPEDFAEFIDTLEEERGTTDVFWVGLYDGYIIADVPYTDDKADTREISYRWDGGDLEEWTKGTSTDPRFDINEIDPNVVADMCDPVVSAAEGATPSDCYVFISKPGEFASDGAWFQAGASDEFGQYYTYRYDKNGVEVGHTPE